MGQTFQSPGRLWRRKPQRPAPTYEDVHVVAEVLSRISVDLIARHFAVSAETAQNFLERLVAERRFGDLQQDGWHYPPIRKLRLRRYRGRPISTSKSKIEEETAASEPESVDDLTQRIDELEQERYALRSQVKRLQAAGKTVIGQREQWKARALAAEGQLDSERSRRSKGDDRFDALRRLVAKELRPDFCSGGDLEKLIRQECFKKLWPEIERLAEHG